MRTACQGMEIRRAEIRRAAPRVREANIRATGSGGSRYEWGRMLPGVLSVPRRLQTPEKAVECSIA
jgi:hypothetical protein